MTFSKDIGEGVEKTNIRVAFNSSGTHRAKIHIYIYTRKLV